MVTAETAVVLPVLVVFTLIGVAAIGVAQARVRCADAARESARSVARGGGPAEPAGIRITLTRQGDLVVARAVEQVHPVSWLPGVSITETAVAAAEPDTVRT